MLPKFNNAAYINISVGQHFGLIDIMASVFDEDIADFHSWYQYKDILKR